MPRLPDSNDPREEERNENGQNEQDSDPEIQALLNHGTRRAKRFLSGFIDFAFQGNVLEIAFGLILASMFTALVTSLMTDILLPPLSVLLPLNKNLEQKFAVLQPGESGSGVYNTLKQAQEDGAVVMAYGFFLNRLLNFVGIGFSLYGIAAFYQWVSKDPIIKHQVKCRYCRKYINEKAARCVNCTSWQDGREDALH